MSEKKVVSRTVAIMLGIVCIILVVGLIAVVANYASIINQKDTTIANLNDIVNIAKSTPWINSQTVSQPAVSYTSWSFSANYTGYVSVNILSSSTINTYAEVIYSSHSVNYDNRIVVGSSGTAIFPILPSSKIEIRVGNTNLTTGATETVVITYYY